MMVHSFTYFNNKQIQDCNVPIAHREKLSEVVDSDRVGGCTW